MICCEAQLNDDLLKQLIALSEDWEAEDSCHGYTKNEKEDIEGMRIFLAKDDEEIIGYLFGCEEIQEKATSVIEEGSRCFEIMEIYVKESFRNHGIGRDLFMFAEDRLKDCDYLTLSTATKDYKAILHFYIEELGMEFWSARLFKKVIK